MTLNNLLISLLVAISILAVTDANGIVSDGQGKRVLVLLDSYGVRETHSNFFKSIKDRGFQINYKVADDSDLALTKYSEYIYDHLILFCPNVVEFGGNMSSKSVVDFIDAGGNVLLAANAQLTEPLKEIAGECGVEFSDEGTYVIDRFNTDINDDGRNTLVIAGTENLINNKMIVGESKTGSPFLYRGVGMTVDPENPLLIEILHGSSTSYSYKPDEQITDYPHTVGKNTILISGMQARNNARIVFAGSLDFFSNDFFNAPVQNSFSSSKKFDKSGNEQLANSIVQWIFKEKGVLRAGEIKHHIVGENSPPAAYTIKQEIIYSIEIEEMVNGKWQAFQGKDVQMEFVRLDPFVRTVLKNSGKGKFYVQYVLPDVYGVFKFVVDYNRLGYTHLFSSTQVSVRPLQHNQYERFIVAAYPYYASIFSMIVGVFLFSFIQLYHDDRSSTVTTGTKKSE